MVTVKYVVAQTSPVELKAIIDSTAEYYQVKPEVLFITGDRHSGWTIKIDIYFVEKLKKQLATQP